MPKTSPKYLHNLLDDRLFGIEDAAGHREKVTLPGLLARYSQGDPTTLTGVQAFQQHPVHAFAVQLAAIALSRAKAKAIAHDEGGWRSLLVAAAEADGAGAEAFALVVEDLSKPAFLQPPVPEGSLEVLKSEYLRPSAELDVLITAKNHDVKVDRIDGSSVEHWVFALLALQTTQGFLGAGNYGIARMNGGFASRPCIAFASDYGASPRFLRDVRALLDKRSALATSLGFGTKGNLGLVWCAPWDGTKCLSFAELDPFFIEICRRIRFSVTPSGTLAAYRGTSKVSRVSEKESSGNTGDAWTPVGRESGRALTISESGFGYEYVQDLLFNSTWQQGAAGEIAEGGDRLWVGQVLVRGQGTTGGYHERWIPMPVATRRMFARSASRAALGSLAKRWVDLAETARLRILKPSLLTLLQGAPAKLKFDDDRANVFLRQLNAAIDEQFFPLLFQYADDTPEAADVAFEKKLVELARDQLNAAIGSLPVPSARRWRAEAHADRVFFGAARKHFKLAFPPPPLPISPEVAPAQGDSQ